MGKRAFEREVGRLRGTGRLVVDPGVGRFRGKEKLVAGREERLHSGKEKLAFVLGVALLPGMVRRALEG